MAPAIAQKAIWAAAPFTERGQPTQLSADSQGKRVAYASGKSIFVRDIDSPEKALQYSEHTAPTTVARFSPNGFKIASGDATGAVRVFEPNAENSFTTKGEYFIIAGRINDIAWDGDSQRIIAVGNGRERFGHCITADSGNSVGEISGHSAQINSVSIKPQRPMRAATGGDDTSLVFYNGPPFKFATSIREKHNRFIFGTAFSPNGEHLLTVGADKRIWLYDGKTGEVISQIGEDEHKGSIFAVSWASDSKRFVTASADQTVKIWNVDSAKVEYSWRLGEEGVLSASRQQLGVVWVHGRKEDLIISLDLEGNLTYLQPGKEAPVRVIRGHQRNITSLASPSPDHVYTGGSDGSIRAWNVTTGAASVVDGDQHSNYVAGLVSSDSSRVHSVGWDDTLRGIDTNAVTFLSESLSPIKGQPRAVAASKSKQILVSTPTSIESFSADGKHQQTTTIKFTPTALAASSLSNIVAVSDDERRLHIYAHAPSGELTLNSTLSSPFPSVVSALAFSKTSEHLAVGLSDGKIHVLNTTDWSVTTTRWSAHTARVTSLDWDEDSKSNYVVSGSLDTHVHVWSLKAPGQRVRAANAHPGGVNAVAWLKPGEIVSAGADGAVKTWTTSDLS